MKVRLGGRGAIAGGELRLRGWGMIWVGDGPQGGERIVMLQAQVSSALATSQLVAFQANCKAELSLLVGYPPGSVGGLRTLLPVNVVVL